MQKPRSIIVLLFTLTEILLKPINIKHSQAFANLFLPDGLFKFVSSKYVVNMFTDSFAAF